MKRVSFGALLLRLQLAVRANALLAGTALAMLACLAALAWTVHETGRLDTERDALALTAARRASTPPPVPVPAPAPAAPDNLAAFYAALGPCHEAGKQLKTLFALAAKNGLSLSQGDYKTAYDRNARVTTYQINLPVKGSYDAIWRLALGALRAIPFASLDDIAFRRDSIGDPAVEARLRLTLYLKDAPGGER